MATEGATYISDLTSNTPAGTASPAEGDDEIRQLKAVLKATLAGPSGTGLAGAVTASHTELNILDGVTSTAAELNILDGVTSTAAELNLVDGSVAGTAVASKAVIYGAKKQVVAFNYSTAEHDAGNSGTALTIDFDNGVNQKLALTGNVDITLSNPLAGQTSKLKITQGASPYTVAFATTVKWPGGVAYSASTGNGDIDIVTLYYDGAAWYGQFAKDFS